LVGDVSNTTPDDLDYYEEILEFIEENALGDYVVFSGYRNDVSDSMNALEVLLHASTEPEPFGRVLLEGMTLSKAIVAARLGGPLEMIVEDKNGLLADPENPDEYAEKIVTLLRNADLRERLGAQAYQTVCERFSSIDTDKLLTVYRKLLS